MAWKMAAPSRFFQTAASFPAYPWHLKDWRKFGWVDAGWPKTRPPKENRLGAAQKGIGSVPVRPARPWGNRRPFPPSTFLLVAWRGRIPLIYRAQS